MKQLLFIFLLFSSSSFGQSLDFEKPNYKKIEKSIADETSNLFYPNLLNRFQKSDTTLTLEEKRHLYYGYSFHPKYSPYAHSDFSDSLRLFLQKEKHNTQDFNKIIEYGDSVLKENPFDLRAINFQLYAFEQKNDKERFKNKLRQMNIIIDALLSSGTGKRKKEAFYVIYTSHEYDLLKVLGLEFGGQQSLIEHYDYLKVSKNEYGIEGLYFDVSPCLNSLSKTFKD